MLKKMMIVLLMASFVFAGVSTTSTKMPLYTCDGSTKAFTFQFPLPDTTGTGIKVVKLDIASGIPTTLTKDIDYTVSATNNDYSSGGTITTTTAYSSAYKILLIRDTPLTQDTDLISDSGVLRTQSLVDAMDKQMMISQELQEKSNRSLRLAETDSNSVLSNIPTSTARANKYLAFDASGNVIASAGPTGDSGVPVSSFISGNLFDDANAAIARTTLAALGTADLPFINAKDYGTALDQNTVQAAIDVAEAAGGGTVIIPKGHWDFSAAVTVKSDAIHIKGEGEGATVIDLTVAGIDGFDFGDASVGKYYYNSIEDLTITSSVTKTAGSAIDIDAVCWFTVEDVFIEKQFKSIRLHNDGTDATLPFRLYINRATIRSVKASTGIGISIEDFLAAVYISNTEIQGAGTGANRCAVGLDFHGETLSGAGGGVVLYNVDTTYCVQGLGIHPDAGEHSTWFWITNCAFDSGYIGAYIHSAGIVEQIFFDDTWFCANSQQGLVMDVTGAGTIQTVRVSGSRACSNGKTGILVTDGNNIDITNCLVSGNSNPSYTGPSATYHGINIDNDVNNFTLTNNRCLYDGGYQWSNSQGYGIYISGTNHNHYSITGNSLTRNATGGMVNQGTGTDKIIKDNLGYVTENSGTGTLDNAATYEVINHGLSVTPTVVNIAWRENPTDSVGDWWVSDIGATSFKLNVANDPNTSNLDFGWEAKLK